MSYMVKQPKFFKEIEAGQYNTALTIIDTVKGTSTAKVYKEVSLCFL